MSHAMVLLLSGKLIFVAEKRGKILRTSVFISISKVSNGSYDGTHDNVVMCKLSCIVGRSYEPSQRKLSASGLL